MDLILDSAIALYLLLTIALLGTTFVSTYLYTSYRYTRALKPHLRSGPPKLFSPPQIPYAVPFLGNAITFLAPYPGAFWTHLFSFHPPSIGSCTLLLGGRKAYILNSTAAVHALFRAKGPTRDQLTEEIFTRSLDMSEMDVRKFSSMEMDSERLNQDFLLKTSAVNELTSKFVQVFRDVLAQSDATTEGEVGLYAWLRKRMFAASTDALMGTRLREMYPDFEDDFFAFDRDFLSFFFSLPRWTIRSAYRTRTKILDTMEEWVRRMYEECGGAPMDFENDVSWEPIFGSRAMRLRHTNYVETKMSMRARAAADLGFVFGLSSNAIPAAGWILLHILDPQGDTTLPERVRAELETAKKDDGTLDIPLMLGLPLLQSILHEMLRLYVDSMVTRVLPADLTLPIDEDGKRKVLLKKDGFIFAPSWLAHRDPVWTDEAPMDKFYAERFLKADPTTGRPVFSTTAAAGKLFPFGGGKSICPGRVFAKQEVLAAVAMVLLGFEIDVSCYVDEQGKTTKSFPGFRKSFVGSGTVVMGGDFAVKIRRRMQ